MTAQLTLDRNATGRLPFAETSPRPFLVCPFDAASPRPTAHSWNHDGEFRPEVVLKKLRSLPVREYASPVRVEVEMRARGVFAFTVMVIWAATAHAQFHERFHERYRPHEYGPRPAYIAPEPRRVEDRSRRPVEPVRTARNADSIACDNTDRDPDAAIDACGRIITRGQTKNGYSLVLAYIHRGEAFENKGDRDHAIADYSEAIRLKPNVPGYFDMRAAAEEKSGAIEAAQSDFRRAIGFDPKNQDALNGLKRIETRSAVRTETPRPGGNGPLPSNAAPSNPAVSGAVASGSTAPSPGATAAPAAVVATPAATTIATALSPAPPASLQGPPNGARIALVIGNGAYVNANPLPNPPNDAHAIAAALRDIGFEVQEGTNLDRAGMEKEFRDFLHKASTAGISLLFYAGHGMQVDGKNYLVPVDAKLAEASDLSFETIEIDKLLNELGDPGHTNIILLDACRDNPLARSFARRLPATRSAAVSTGLAAYSAVGTGTLIAYATAPGQTALDGDGSNSPFTTSLLHNIRVPGLEIRQVLTRVRAEVAARTGNKQIPWDNSSLMGDVVLVGQAQ